MIEADVSYFQRRLEQELQRARTTEIPEVAAIHRRLAEGYEALLHKASTAELLTA